MHLVLTYFDRLRGPSIFLSYPEIEIEEDTINKLIKFFDLDINETFFEIVLINKNKKIINLYIEIPSEWARGNKEMLMVTIIFDQQTTKEIEDNISSLCMEFSEKLQSNEEIFTAFYINDLSNFEEADKENIIKNDSLIKAWVKNLYWAIIEETREKSEEEKIAIMLNKEHIFRVLEMLSKGPMTLEGIEEWFIENFPNRDFDEMIDTLVEKQFIFINQIGRIEKYVLLLKEVNAERIPPDSVIEYIDETPELIDLLLPKVQEYFSAYMTKTPEEIREDSFTLFQIMSDPKKYNVLSELRNGLIIRDDLPKLVSKKALDSLIENIDFLRKYDVIEELKYGDETYIVLKTNLQITTSFPKYLSKLLPKESKQAKSVVANKYSPQTAQQEEMAEIFRDVRNRGELKTKTTKISTFLEDLSSRSKKE